MKTNNKYFLLRHGQTIYQKNSTRVNYPAGADSTLSITEEGEEMIKTAAESLKNKNIDLIFASPALRTKQSANIAAGILAIKEINYDERLVDINMGIFAGKTYEEYEEFFVEKRERFTKKPEGSETWNEILERLKSFLAEVEEKYKDKNILIISHADPIWLFAGLLKGFSKEEEFLATRKSGDAKNLYPNVGEIIYV
jgi:broad specificity phosphatase PhoE